MGLFSDALNFDIECVTTVARKGDRPHAALTVSTNSMLCWDVTPCSVVDVCQRFRQIYATVRAKRSCSEHSIVVYL